MNIHFAFLWLSFSECYASELGPLAVSEEGEEEGSVPLEHLITCIPGINIVTAQNGFKVIKWIHNKPPASNTGIDLTLRPNPRGELHWKPLFRLAEESLGVHKSNTNLQNLNPIFIKNGNPYRVRTFSKTLEDTREAIRIVSGLCWAKNCFPDIFSRWILCCWRRYQHSKTELHPHYYYNRSH